MKETKYMALLKLLKCQSEELEYLRRWLDDDAYRWNDGCGCCGNGETVGSTFCSDTEYQTLARNTRCAQQEYDQA